MTVETRTLVILILSIFFHVHIRTLHFVQNGTEKLRFQVIFFSILCFLSATLTLFQLEYSFSVVCCAIYKSARNFYTPRGTYLFRQENTWNIAGYQTTRSLCYIFIRVISPHELMPAILLPDNRGNETAWIIINIIRSTDIKPRWDSAKCIATKHESRLNNFHRRMAGFSLFSIYLFLLFIN